MFDTCHFLDSAPDLSSSSRALCLIYDEKLLSNSEFNSWKDTFKYSYSLTAGEDLKSLDSFNIHIKELQAQLADAGPVSFVAAGGGSIGDFVGFMASVYKRGVPLVHVPTTYLAALDSAHGGKTALNLGDTKNQVGSFYPAEKIYIVKSFLKSLSEEHLRDACGELVKMAFIEDLKLYFDLKYLPQIDFEDFWRILPDAVKAKYDVVDKDPKEETGLRQILNLGHTVGHLYESQLKLSHGVCVSYGLVFALKWGYKKSFLNREKYKEKLKIIEVQTGIKIKKIPKLDKEIFIADLKNDKKYAKAHYLHFIFVRGSGEVVRELVHEDELVKEALRQGVI